MSAPETPTHAGDPRSSSNVQLGAVVDDDDDDPDQRLAPTTTTTTRPISLNGVKKELKRRLLSGGPTPQPTSDSRGGSRAIVLRAEGTNDGGLGSGDPTSNFNSGSSSTSNSDDEDDQDDNQDDDKSHPHPPTTTSTSLGNPSANPRRRAKAGPRQINQYTLNMYNNHPHAVGSAVGSGPAGSSSSLSGLGGPTGGMGLSSGLGGGEGSALGMGMGMGMGVGVGTGGSRGKGWVDADLPYIFIG